MGHKYLGRVMLVTCYLENVVKPSFLIRPLISFDSKNWGFCLFKLWTEILCPWVHWPTPWRSMHLSLKGCSTSIRRFTSTKSVVFSISSWTVFANNISHSQRCSLICFCLSCLLASLAYLLSHYNRHRMANTDQDVPTKFCPALVIRYCFEFWKHSTDYFIS